MTHKPDFPQKIVIGDASDGVVPVLIDGEPLPLPVLEATILHLETMAPGIKVLAVRLTVQPEHYSITRHAWSVELDGWTVPWYIAEGGPEAQMHEGKITVTLPILAVTDQTEVIVRGVQQ